MYRQLSAVYDELMSNVPYDKWVNYVQACCRRFQVAGKKMLDLGCGTGTLTTLLDKHFEMTGVDLSANMLTIARDKLPHVPFFQQNMIELDLNDQFDIIVTFCDSLNYVTDESDVMTTFERVSDHLVNGGLFLFDVHSLYTIQSVYKDATFAYDSEQVAYIWNCFVEEDDRVEHDLTLFVKQHDEYYKRYDEWHIQKTFPIDKYKQMLSQTGFTILNVSADFEWQAPKKTSERIFFATKKGF